MGIVGRAIGRYLRERQGVFSVELPAVLEDEMSSLVSLCNRKKENSAFLVLPGQEDKGTSDYGCATISWSELLRWRTDDDRVFVWARDTGEPHSSFQSVVTTFIGRRFPGEPGGTCSPRLLSRLCAEEVWREFGEEPEQESHSFQAFRETVGWVIRVVRHNYQYNGGSPKAHWSDGFFVHWSRVCEGLAAEFNHAGEIGYRPEAGDAWEVLRQAGLPVPVKVPEDSRILAHSPMHEIDGGKRSVSRLSNQWQELADSYVLPEGKTAILRSALDKFCAGESGASPWSGLPLERGSETMLGTPAVEAMRPVFTAESAQSYFSRGRDAQANDQTRRWWGVSLPDVLEALDRLTEEEFLSPIEGGGPLFPLDSEDDSYLILTHLGRVEYDHTDKRWRVYVRFENLGVEYSEHWTSVHLRQSEPDRDPGEGAYWVKPDDVQIRVRGTGVKVTDVTAAQSEDGTALNINFGLEIKFQATKDDGSAKGSWKPACTLKVKTRVREWTEGSWQVRTTDESELDLVVPNPFSPTVIVDAGQIIVPENDDSYEYRSKESEPRGWRPISTPDLLLDEECKVGLLVYDGQLSVAGSDGSWLPATTVIVGSTELDSIAVRIWATSGEDGLFLREGNSISIRRSEDSPEDAVATVRIKESTGEHTSALEALVQGDEIGEPDPATEARESLLGKAQQTFASSLAGEEKGAVELDSLYQYVLSTGASAERWRQCSGKRGPVYLVSGINSVAGAGQGASDELRATDEWGSFTRAAKEVVDHLRLQDSDGAIAWLSSVPFRDVPAEIVQRYVRVHAELLDRARTLATRELFWASFPFSVFVVEGESSAELGALRAVLLSPLHPVRFAWQFGYELLASRCNRDSLDKVIFGLAESWNIPLTGTGISRTGQSNPLVSAPLSAGDGNDFVGWSGLALLRTDSGLPYYPPRAGGYELPWAGQSGINNRVVREALDDFVNVHPHLTSLEIDVRSQREGPRSREIDQALLTFVREAVFGDEVLGGGVRVWDGTKRKGPPPRREAVVPKSGSSGLFEWRIYDEETRTHADISFIENPNVHFSINSVTEEDSNVLGAVALRRFMASFLDDNHFVQPYRTGDTRDFVGLSALIDAIEHGDTARQPALLATVSAEGLGLEEGSRWDVLGSLNIDPALLARIATESQGKILWEWRPSWLKSVKRGASLTPRPYYVVARIPVSLVQALERQHGISQTRVGAMLSLLGESGVGLATLSAQGGTQASAAAGFYYAMKMLAVSTGAEESPGKFRGLLPVDPVYDLMSAAAGGPAAGRRADFVLIDIKLLSDESPIVQMMPVEVKHRGRFDRPAPFPDRDSSGLGGAREQLLQTADLLEGIVANAAGTERGEDPWTEYGHRLALVSLLELSCSLGSHRASPAVRSALVSGVLDGSVRIAVTDPLLLWYAPGTADNEGVASQYEAIPQGQYVVHELFVDPDSVPGLLWDDSSPGDNEQHTRRRLREAIDAALSGGVPEAAFDASGGPIVQRLRESVGLAEREEEREVVSGDGARVAETGGKTSGGGPGPEGDEEHHEEGQDSTRESSGDAPTGPQQGKETRNTESGGAAPETRDSGDRESDEGAQDKRVDGGAGEETGDTVPTPDILIGAQKPTSRWTIVGKTPRTEESVALDLNNPKTLGVFGYMGSGKSYFLGTLIEGAAQEISGINRLGNPLSVVVFNYRQQASDRFELDSLTAGNQDPQQVERLKSQYGAAPRGLEDVHVLQLPGTGDRQDEYQGLQTHEMYFDPAELSLEDWELLMGEPESDRVYAQTIRHCLNRLHQSADQVTLSNLMDRVEDQLSGSSLNAARRRFDFARDYLSEDRGVDFNELLEPGRVVIVDLRKSLFKKEDALRFFLICARQVSKVQGEFNKLVIFDEAHEYLSDAFGARMESRIRLMRHEGTSYVFATQDVDSIPEEVRRFITTTFVFELGTRQNVKDLLSRFGKVYEGKNLLSRDTGSCLIQANKSTNDIMANPRDVIIRPRVTSHGGESRIHDGARE